MDNTVTIKLDFSIPKTVGSREEPITSVTLRRPRVKDIKGLNLKELEGDDLITLVRRISGLSEKEMGEVDVTDLTKMSEAAGNFFPTPSKDETDEGEN